MTSLTRRFFLNSYSGNLYKIQPHIKCIRQMHFAKNQHFSIVTSRLLALNSSQNACIASSPFIFNQVRFKSNKRNRRKKDSDDEASDDEAIENQDKGLSDFKEGDGSDRILARVKTQTLRLDSVIKAALGTPKNQIEKLFYSSAIRLNGEKVTKKSMDIFGECEIDIVKGPSPENDKFLLVNRIEILQVTSEGSFFVITIRRQKNLTIENYEISPY
ncbi:uncharacterized protein LOC116339272 [Contarinia nasturtii]|uniref:uncharacterized protein LOC116339272 n=1 Tax=Contarinia nasturtii TaxID=265458 RepID=UPI0012D3BCBE|nr:uncharacterized protein LOC116339272 [Contarinia nasturtii]